DPPAQDEDFSGLEDPAAAPVEPSGTASPEESAAASFDDREGPAPAEHAAEELAPADDAARQPAPAETPDDPPGPAGPATVGDDLAEDQQERLQELYGMPTVEPDDR